MKAAYNLLQEKILEDNETAARSQKRVEKSLANVQTQLNVTGQELSECKRVKEELVLKLSDVTTERDSLAVRVSELAAMKAALETEQSTLHDLNHTLEVKVICLLIVFSMLFGLLYSLFMLFKLCIGCKARC